MKQSGEQQPIHQTTTNWRSFPHIIPAIMALVILAGTIIAFDRYGSALEDRYIHALAPLQLPQTLGGSVLQQAGLRQPDLLPVYGSSEMLSEPSHYQAENLFAAYPTGFEIFNISNMGENPLEIAQDLAAIGTQLKDKKVVFSFTPTLFNRVQINNDQYDGNFSSMHAYAMIFSSNLSMSLKQRVAKRMLDYPETLKKDMLLSMAVRNLAKGGLPGLLKYSFVFPIGQLELLIQRMQDHYAVWNYIQVHPEINPVVIRRSQSIDWGKQLEEAEAEQRKATSNNPYGIENDEFREEWEDEIGEIKPIGSTDKKYISLLDHSKEWGDVEFVMEIFREMGASPLILSLPIHGPEYEADGVSPQAQQVYYTKLESLVGSYRFPLADFKEYTDNALFSVDWASHTSRMGWVIIDHRLDVFYHAEVK